MTDPLIPDDTTAALQRFAHGHQSGPFTVDELIRFGLVFNDLTDEEAIRQAWKVQASTAPDG